MTNNKKLVDHLFRQEYGKLVAALTRFFGTAYIQLAEDVVQDTLISAMENWAKEGIPNNPAAWLMQVAKRKGLNELKRNQMIRNHHNQMMTDQEMVEIEHVFLETEISDNQLRMIFTCCHPSLNRSAQIALTLKTLCGFGVKEVARALLTSTSTINKRLYRAKETIRKSNLNFGIPSGNELDERLEMVMLTLYLMFNEGYNSSTGNAVIRKDICLEAIRLTQLLVIRFPSYHKLNALLALFCFHTARFEARIDEKGAIILFEDQDRSLWSKELIEIGMGYFRKAIGGTEISTYHIEANIAAIHCLAESFETTDWQQIYEQYQLLGRMNSNPIIQLNLAIIQSQLMGIETSLLELKALEKDSTLKDYHLLPATQGAFSMKLDRYKEAENYFIRAIRLEPSTPEREFIERQLKLCKEKRPN